MKKEIDAFIAYIQNGVVAYHDDDIAFLNKMGKLTENDLIPFEAPNSKINGPDFFIRVGDRILMVEHFEFDASSFKDNKGTNSRCELGRINNEFTKLAKEKKDSPPINQTNEIRAKYTYENYTKNLKRNFGLHYNKIEQYTANILNSDPGLKAEDISTCFFIVDSTPLGSYYKQDGNLEPLTIFQVPEFISILENSVPPKIDYIFNGLFYTPGYHMHFTSVNNLINNNGKPAKLNDLHRDRYFTFPTPQVHSFQIKGSSKI